MNKILVAFLLILTTISCNTNESQPLSQEQFIDFYIDIQKFDETISKENVDSLRMQLHKQRIVQILEFHKITKEDVLETVNYYNTHPLLWKYFFDSVNVRLAKMKNSSD